MSGIDQDLAAQALRLRNRFTPAQLAQLMRLIGPVPGTGLMSAEKFERVMAMMAGAAAPAGVFRSLDPGRQAGPGDGRLCGRGRP